MIDHDPDAARDSQEEKRERLRRKSRLPSRSTTSTETATSPKTKWSRWEESKSPSCLGALVPNKTSKTRFYKLPAAAKVFLGLK